MNLIKATLKNIAQKDTLRIAEFVFDGERIYMMALELPQKLRIGESVILGIKPTHIAIRKDFDVDSSFDNQLKISIVSIEAGELLVNVKGAVGGVILESVITLKSYLRMNLQVGNTAVILLPASELFIVE